MMLDARYWMLAKKGVIPYRYPVSRNQYPVSLPNESQSLPNESQTSLYGDEAVKPKNIILRAIWSFKFLSVIPLRGVNFFKDHMSNYYKNLFSKP
jgi:hypothetical protein